MITERWPEQHCHRICLRAVTGGYGASAAKPFEPNRKSQVVIPGSSTTQYRVDAFCDYVCVPRLPWYGASRPVSDRKSDA